MVCVFLAGFVLSLASSRHLRLVFATDYASAYATKGVPHAWETVQRHATCHVTMEHHTTANWTKCSDPHMTPYHVHDTVQYLRDAACAAWLRYYAAESAQSDGWALYLDADTEARGDVCQLLEVLDDTHAIAAVEMPHYTLYHKDFFNASQLFRHGVTRLYRHGLNNGVFAFHPQRWRERNITSRIWDWQIRAHNATTPLFHYNDMAAFTLVALEEGYQSLPPRFNCMDEKVEGCVIRHFAGQRKPWS